MDPNNGCGQGEQNSQFLGEDCHDGQNWEISVEDCSSEEWNLLNGAYHLQSWDFGNQSVAGTGQPALGALEFADNAIQTLSSYDQELKEQQFNQLLADTLGAFNSIDQVSPLPASGPQLPENQMPAGIQVPLAQQQFAQAVEKELTRLDRKRKCDREYRKREREKKQKLMDENQALVVANQEKDQLVKALKAHIQKLEDLWEKQTKLEAEKEHLAREYLRLEEREENNSSKMEPLLGKFDDMEQQMKDLGKQGIEKPRKKRKKQVMMAKTMEESKNDG